jgi:hypothetical protein
LTFVKKMSNKKRKEKKDLLLVAYWFIPSTDKLTSSIPHPLITVSLFAGVFLIHVQAMGSRKWSRTGNATLQAPQVPVTLGMVVILALAQELATLNQTSPLGPVRDVLSPCWTVHTACL